MNINCSVRNQPGADSNYPLLFSENAPASDSIKVGFGSSREGQGADIMAKKKTPPPDLTKMMDSSSESIEKKIAELDLELKKCKDQMAKMGDSHPMKVLLTEYILSLEHHLHMHLGVIPQGYTASCLSIFQPKNVCTFPPH